MRIESEEMGVFNRRFGIRARDGARVEAVLYRGNTLCISTQVGCAVRCPFCASGAEGLGRNLSLAELEAQVALVAVRHSVQRVTLSGIGEPLHNHAACASMLETSRNAGRKVSLTTTGGPLARLREWLALPHNGLTLSVHAGSETVRERLVPHGPKLDDVFALLCDVLPQLSAKRRKKTALAYLMLAGVNDSNEELDAFAARALAVGLRVHLYAYNSVGTSDAQAVTRAAYETAYVRLSTSGLSVHMSSQARMETNGGCGTLVAVRP